MEKIRYEEMLPHEITARRSKFPAAFIGLGKIGAAVAALAVVGLIVVNVVQSKSKKAPVVTVQKVERTDLRSLVTATGKIAAQKKVDLSANVMGQIVNLAVREGDRVAKGDFLLQIDLTQRRASALSAEESLKALFFDRDSARATAEEAQKSYERAQRSFADQIIPQADVDRARATADAAAANVKAVERRIDTGVTLVTRENMDEPGPMSQKPSRSNWCRVSCSTKRRWMPPSVSMRRIGQ